MAIVHTAILFGATLGAPAEESGIDWRWRRFQAWEYAATSIALGTGLYLRFAGPSPDADWTGGILFDDDVRDSVAVQNLDTRAWVVRIADGAYFGSMAYRAVDSVLVPGVGWGNWDTALQMSMIDLEAFGFVAITLWGSQALFGRQRPYVDRCDDPAFAKQERGCAPGSQEPNRSLYAGHPAVGLTAAGLTCVHHGNLPLYGGAGDPIACGAMLGLAAINGYARLAGDKHYASDLVVGIGIGAFAGFVLPELLHYAHPRPRSSAGGSAPPVRLSVLPLVDGERFGALAHGRF
jgi:membrane-associated phospholipid phosphatase